MANLGRREFVNLISNAAVWPLAADGDDVGLDSK
jgi:hypothetical protein